MGKILVTGATGFVGKHLIEGLIERGEDVCALVRESSDIGHLQAHNIETRVGELSDKQSLDRALAGIDLVYHCAARPPLQGTKHQYFHDNDTGTRNFVEVALNHSISRFLHVSTVDVYGYRDHHGTDETSPLIESKEFYATSKVRSDQTVLKAHKEHGFPVTIARPCAIYGPFDENSFPGIIKYLSKPFAPLIDGGNNLMDLVYVRDAVEGIILAANNPDSIGQCYNLTDGVERTFKQIMDALCEIVQIRPKFVFTSSKISYPMTSWAHSILMFFGSGLPKHYQPEVVKVMSLDRHYSIEKAQRELGYNPEYALEAGMKLTAEWYFKDYKNQ